MYAETVPECLSLLYGLAHTLSQRHFSLQESDVKAATLATTRAAVSKEVVEPKS